MITLPSFVKKRQAVIFAYYLISSVQCPMLPYLGTCVLLVIKNNSTLKLNASLTYTLKPQSHWPRVGRHKKILRTMF